MKMLRIIARSRIIYLCICFCLIWIHISIVRSETAVCSTQYETQLENFRFNCSVSEITSEIDCATINHRSLTVRRSSEDYSTIICTSNYAINVDVKFNDGIALKEYLNMTWRREIVDITDTSTYTYQLQIFPPQSNIDFYVGEAVWYTFSSWQYPSENIDVLWISPGHTNRGYNKVYWMKEKRMLDISTWIVKDDALHIPCVSHGHIQIKKYGDKGFNEDYYSRSNVGTYFYARENKTDLLGEYWCFCDQYSDFLNFTVIFQTKEYSASYRVYFNESNGLIVPAKAFIATKKYLYRPDRSINILNTGTEGLKFELKCQLRDQKPKFNIRYPNSKIKNTECNSTMVSIKDHFTNHTLNTAICMIQNIQKNKSVAITCGTKGNEFDEWRISRVPAVNENELFAVEEDDYYMYLSDNHEMECSFQFTFNMGIDEEYCHNPITCRILKHILQKRTTVKDDANVCRGNYPWYTTKSVIRCVKIKLSQKGIFHCKLDYDHSEDIRYLWNLYFIGLNKIVYIGIDSNPPIKAIIQLRNLGQSEQIMIKNDTVKFTFYCEAHSFYFEEGIQWLFEYKNGTQQLIPQEYISHYDTESRKEYVRHSSNPSSYVDILVPEKIINRIICAAPRLSVLNPNNFREWVFESLNISILDGVAPSLVDTRSKFYFVIGEQTNAIKCQAFGLPKPEVHWSAMSGQNLSMDFIIDLPLYSELIFHNYSKIYEGNYLCTATNAVGNASKIISVYTKDSSLTAWSGTKLALTLTLPLLTMMVAILASLYLYIRKLKLKQSMEMEDILKLLHGETINEEENTNPLETHYDIKWELEQHSFCIDQSKILGCGEFGIVYKGTIAKVSMDVAFKSLKYHGNMTHLRSLVSELKLLLYIGKHLNIVELLGAYTKEINKGVIYVAIEFCALGSLERYLRSNRGRFQKCSFLTSYFENCNMELNCDLSESSNHTIKSLLSWCAEIAGAMDYLYSRKVVHGDLATRNILLTADWTTKLTDFGLSRRTYYSDDYVKAGKDPLPWRWLALESLLLNVFNVKTDVWAFGITLWEIFSLGEIPYPGLSANMEFVTELKGGLRNPRPSYGSSSLYDVMVACWNCEADERPSFASLRVLFQNALQNEDFQVNVEYLESIGSTEKETNQYLELEEVTTNQETEL